MKLNKKGFGLKEMIIISSVLLLFLLFVAYYIFVLYNDLDDSVAYTYKVLETKLQNAAIKYNLKYKTGEIITVDTLVDEGYLEYFTDSNDDECDGYVEVGNKDYKPYIRCKHYTTKGYKK